MRHHTSKTTLILIILSATVASAQDIDRQGLESITPAEMQAHVAYLASDAMRGRNTPSPELDSCAAYIAREFESAGLSPVDEESNYFQPFNVVKVRLGGSNTLHIETPDGATQYDIRRDFTPIKASTDGDITAPLVCVGYGITAPDLGYDDYRDIDVSGKIVFMMTGKPRGRNAESPFAGLEQAEHGRIERKIQNAVDHGAAGLLLVSNPTSRFRRPPNRWPSLMRSSPTDAVPLTMEQTSAGSLPCMHIGKDLANDLLGRYGHSLTALRDSIDLDLLPRSFPMPEVTVRIETNLTTERFPTQNVIGYWEGDDPELKDEIIVIGAHYDHVGVRDDTVVYNGADDNASGTAGVIELAEAFTRCGNRPKRSVLFMTFSGEEKGLFGSRFAADHPVIPEGTVVAMLNMDMISRNDTLAVDVIGARSSPDLKQSCEDAGDFLGLELSYTQQYFRQSDHYPFYLKDIPVLLFSSGDTEDLHRPTDDPEKTIPEKMAGIARLVFSTAWLVANQPQPPAFTKID